MELSATDMDKVCKDWIGLLTLVVGLPQDVAIAWARDHRSAMHSPLFLHETTSWYILPLIITDDVRRRTRSLGDLESKIDLALERFRQKMWRDVDAMQINAIRTEIREIVDSYIEPSEP